MRDIIIIGHRGAAAHAPENTLQSFETALRMGADMVELDVQMTKDGHLVCIHDYEVDRTTNGSGQVCEMTLEEIKSLDTGRGQTIPLLSEVLDFAKGRIGVNIEIKVPDVEEQLLKLVRERDMLDEVIFSSFFHSSLSIIKVLEPNAVIAVLFNSEIENVVQYAKNLNADAINPLFLITTAGLIEEAHQQGLKVFPWTINDKEIMREFFVLGVDGIITDMPGHAVNVLDEFLLKG